MALPSTPSGRRAPGRSERGETLVEFAFASLIFFAMVFGALEFGIAVWNYNLVSDLAQEGARYAAVHGQNSGSPVNEAAVNAFVLSRAAGLPVNATTPAGPPNSKLPGATVEVRVSYTLAVGGGVIPAWNIPIYSSAKMIVAR